jgi:UDP-N-acetylglucosamine 2-epimerase (non-hydrolysing)
MKKIAIVLGTRPEIIKMSPVISYCQKTCVNYVIIHSNQHYSKYLDQIFFDQLQLPKPNYDLEVGSGTHGEQTAKILQRIEKILMEIDPNFVLVHGDTNTTLAGALSAAKLNIPVGHVEAGLRSHDRKMPEEINRIMTDHLSDFCFAPTENQKEILKAEGIAEKKIIVTGNTIVDAVNRNVQLITNEILEKLAIEKNNYFLTTIHRPENVDDKKRLLDILTAIGNISNSYNKPIIAPFHPRTVKAIKKYGISVNSSIKIIEPVGYMEFLSLLKNTRLVMTDSGGIQEEACILNIPCVTVRKNTERPETLTVGANILAGISQESIIRATEKMYEMKDYKWENPFGDGNSSEKIIKTILDN